MSLLLALDSSTLTAGVAISALDGDTRVLASLRRHVTKHSDALLALVDETLAAARVEKKSIAAIACGAGPGSFTGLRIGLATAKGLCFALSCPLITISSLEILAARATGEVGALLDAHKDEVYAGRFFVEDGVPRPLEVERVLAPRALAAEWPDTLPLVGDGALRYREIFSRHPLVDEDGAPRPDELARLAAQKFARGELADLASASPKYIRPSEAELLKNRRG
jgi:tRNA threonylcarbamoyladenosine biosynthesis protein TsaB